MKRPRWDLTLAPAQGRSIYSRDGIALSAGHPGRCTPHSRKINSTSLCIIINISCHVFALRLRSSDFDPRSSTRHLPTSPVPTCPPHRPPSTKQPPKQPSPSPPPPMPKWPSWPPSSAPAGPAIRRSSTHMINRSIPSTSRVSSAKQRRRWGMARFTTSMGVRGLVRLMRRT